MRRRLALALPLLLLACGGGDDEASGPCDLLTPSAARRVAGAGLEPMELTSTLQLPSVEERACIYAPPGTEAGDEPSRVAALQLDEGMPYDTEAELLETSGVGAEAVDVGRGAIIETERGGFTIVALVDDDRSFALVVRGPDVERESVIDLARAIAEELTSFYSSRSGPAAPIASRYSSCASSTAWISASVQVWPAPRARTCT